MEPETQQVKSVTTKEGETVKYWPGELQIDVDGEVANLTHVISECDCDECRTGGPTVEKSVPDFDSAVIVTQERWSVYGLCQSCGVFLEIGCRG